MVFLMMFRQVLGQYLPKSYDCLLSDFYLLTILFPMSLNAIQPAKLKQLHTLISESVVQIKLLLQSRLSVLIPHTIINFINHRFHNLKVVI